MLPFYSRIERYVNTKVYGIGLSIFRIVFSAILLFEISYLFYFRHLLFDPVPFLVEAEISFSIVLVFWFVVVFFLLIGLKTRTAALINYIFVLILFSSLTTAKYHLDATFIGISFLFLFIPVSTRLSFDSFLYKLKKLDSAEELVSKIHYALPVLLVLCLQYFDSFLHKIASEIWLKGLGIWLPASLPNHIYAKHPAILNQEWLVMGLSYLVIAFEAFFILLVLNKKTRIAAILLGIAFHLSIAFTFPIPLFGFTLASIYIILIPVSFWKMAGSFFKRKTNKTLLLPVTTDPISHKIGIIINHFSFISNLTFIPDKAEKKPIIDSQEILFKVGNNSVIADHKACLPFGFLLNLDKVNSLFILLLKRIPLETNTFETDETGKTWETIRTGCYYFLICYLIIGQLIKSLNSPLIKQSFDIAGVNTVRNKLEKVLLPIAATNKKFIGLTEGLVYTSFREKSYLNIAIAINSGTTKTVFLPVTDQEGLISFNNSGRLFTKWNRVLDSYQTDRATFERGLIQFTTFWAIQNEIPLAQTTFEILAKPVIVKFEWEKNYLDKQISQPWKKIGTIKFMAQKPVVTLY